MSAAPAAIRDYSQNGEQAAILAACGSKPGMFMDIGAWHPKRLSNTRALYELGWSGIMIEPSPYPMRQLLEEYGKDPRITLIQAVVHGQHAEIPQMHISDDAFSTTEAAQFDKWNSHARYIGNVYVPGVTLIQIAARFGVPTFIDIDTEGSSGDLFRQMLRLGWRPRCICVEHDSHVAELKTAANDAGYELTFSNDVNLIFVQKEIAS